MQLVVIGDAFQGIETTRQDIHHKLGVCRDRVEREYALRRARWRHLHNERAIAETGNTEARAIVLVLRCERCAITRGVMQSGKCSGTSGKKRRER